MTTAARRAVCVVLAAALLGGLGGLAGCSTTFDPTETTAAPTAPTTAPTGTREQLFARLLEEMAGLSERVVDNEGDDEALARIDALWAVVRPQVEAERPELLGRFDRAVEYAHRAVERRRPADADKATMNLRTLIDAY